VVLFLGWLKNICEFEWAQLMRRTLVNAQAAANCQTNNRKTKIYYAQIMAKTLKLVSKDKKTIKTSN